MRSPAIIVGLLLASALLLVGGYASELVDPALFRLNLYLLASVVFVADGVDVVIRLLARRMQPTLAEVDAGDLTEQAERATVQPYAILISVHNLAAESSAVLRQLAPFKSRTWIVDDCSSDATALLLKQSGWRCLKLPINRKKPGAIKALLERLPAEIKTVVVMDPDVEIVGQESPETDFETAVRSLQRSGAAACCPRVKVRPDGVLANFQVVEYAFSFELGRRSLGRTGITSGVAVYQRDRLESALARHSLSVYAEDLENSMLLLGSGESVYYDARLVVQTEGQRRLSGWFSQRVGWSFGLIKVVAERRNELMTIARQTAMAFYQYALYMTLSSILLFPLKLFALGLLVISAINGVDNLLGADLLADNGWTSPVYFAAVYLKYTFLTLICVIITRPGLSLDRYLITLPGYFFYALAHMIPTAIGYLNYLTLRFFGRRVFRDHYDAAPKLLADASHPTENIQ